MAAFMQVGVERSFQKLHIDYDVFFYPLQGMEYDLKLKQQLEEKIQCEDYDMVFSINFIPLVLEICHIYQMKYVSWVYDCPCHIDNADVERLRDTDYELYSFDRVQVATYRQQGLEHAYHLPLAVDTDIFSSEVLAQYQQTTTDYACDVSMVGQLYTSEYEKLCRPLNTYGVGYLEGIVESQRNVRGAYFLEELCTEELMEQLNMVYRTTIHETFQLKKEQMAFVLAKEVTNRERVRALQCLQYDYKVKLYSKASTDVLDAVEHMGYISYYEQMADVFRGSKVNLNISLCAISSGIPLRVFDVLGSGGFLLTNYQPEIMEWFEDGVDLVLYENIPDLAAKVQYYLTHEEERARIARSGYEKVREYHTFVQRVQQMQWYQERYGEGVIA